MFLALASSEVEHVFPIGRGTHSCNARYTWPAPQITRKKNHSSRTTQMADQDEGVLVGNTYSVGPLQLLASHTQAAQWLAPGCQVPPVADT